MGFGLIEAVVSAGVVVTIATGLLQLMSMSVTSVRAAADDTSALLLAIQKMEQLRGLAWTYDMSGRRLSDFTTNASSRAPASGGRGLMQSPPDSLTRNASGYVDFLDSSGHWIGSGSTPPSGAAFVRRWAIGSADAVGLDTLVVMVVVVPMPRIGRSEDGEIRLNDPGVVWLMSVRDRH
jgi:type II secretory pathway pseudopilin PulG